MANPDQGTAVGSGADADSAVIAAKDAAIQSARSWIQDINDTDFWTDSKAKQNETKYFNVILDLEKPSVKNNKANYPWKVTGSTAREQNARPPKGKTGTIGPAAPPPGPVSPLAPPSPTDPCTVVFLDHGDIPTSTHETRSAFVVDAFDAVKDKISQYICPTTCADLRADLHVTLKFEGFTDVGTPQWGYKVHWKLRMFCYEDERKK